MSSMFNIQREESQVLFRCSKEQAELEEYWHLPDKFGYGLVRGASSWSLLPAAKIPCVICLCAQTPTAQELCSFFIFQAPLLNQAVYTCLHNLNTFTLRFT